MKEGVKEMKDRARGFVFLEADPDRTERIRDKALDVDEVAEAHIITGE